MKNSRSEKLSEYLSNVDEDILGKAYNIDDAEGLRQYIKEKMAIIIAVSNLEVKDIITNAMGQLLQSKPKK